MTDKNGDKDEVSTDISNEFRYIDDEEYFDQYVQPAPKTPDQQQPPVAKTTSARADAEAEKPRKFFDDRIIADELAFLSQRKHYPEFASKNATDKPDPPPVEAKSNEASGGTETTAAKKEAKPSFGDHYAAILNAFAPDHHGNSQTDPKPKDDGKQAPPAPGGPENGHFLFGLALSGGGIRSGTFSLGVLQYLAAKKILPHVDYLSTVSGGGYIGSALTWWLNGIHQTKNLPKGVVEPEHFKGCKTTAGELDLNTSDCFPWGTADPKQPNYSPNPILRFLRENGKYLTPGHGLTLASGVVILLRAILLNLLVWIPLVALVFAALIFASDLTAYLMGGLKGLIGNGVIANTIDQIGAFVMWVYEAIIAEQARVDAPHAALTFVGFLCISALIIIAYCVSSVNYSVLQFTNMEGGKPQDQSGQNSNSNYRVFGPVRWIAALVLVAAIVALFFFVVKWVQVLLPALFGRASTPGAFEDILAAINGRAIPKEGALALEDLTKARLANLDEIAKATARFWYFALVPLVLVSVWYAAKGVLHSWKLFGWSRLIIPVAAFLVCMVGAWFSYRHQMGRAYAVFYVIFAVGLFLYFNFWAAECIRWLFRQGEADLRYGGRRQFEIRYGHLLTSALLLAIIGSIPVIHGFIPGWIGKVEGGVGGIVLGSISTVWGFFREPSKEGGGFGNLVLVLGAYLFLYGVMLIGYDLSLVFYCGTETEVVILLSIAVLSVLTGYLTNINFISLNRFYRDRLMEAFMPLYSTVCEGRNRAATGADTFNMCEVGRADEYVETQQGEEEKKKKKKMTKEKLVGPYHMINTNVMLTHAEERKFRKRMGDNFIVSPLYVGGAATGFGPSGKFMGGNFTVATAMSASAAAANPGGGAGGKGVTTNSAVALVMRLLNIRLSYWVRHPRETLKDKETGDKTQIRKSIWALTPNHFVPGALYSLPWFGYKKDDSLLELSDGAHFENLGVYELIRRRCGLIIVCDGGQDVKASYSDLINAIERVGEDFGAQIRVNEVEIARNHQASNGEELWETSQPDDLIGNSNNTDQYPKGAEYAKKGYFVAKIDYGNRGESGAWPRYGILIYLKTTMIGRLEIEAKGYKGANPDFPDETTGDQFFEEEQFEAYREVGYRIAETMIEDLDLAERFLENGKPKRPKFQELMISDSAWKSSKASPKPTLPSGARLHLG